MFFTGLHYTYQTIKRVTLLLILSFVFYLTYLLGNNYNGLVGSYTVKTVDSTNQIVNFNFSLTQFTGPSFGQYMLFSVLPFILIVIVLIGILLECMHLFFNFFKAFTKQLEDQKKQTWVDYLTKNIILDNLPADVKTALITRDQALTYYPFMQLLSYVMFGGLLISGLLLVLQQFVFAIVVFAIASLIGLTYFYLLRNPYFFFQQELKTDNKKKELLLPQTEE